MREDEIPELLELWRRHPETHEEIRRLLESQEPRRKLCDYPSVAARHLP